MLFLSDAINCKLSIFLWTIMASTHKQAFFYIDLAIKDVDLLYFLVSNGTIMCFPVEFKIGHTENLMRFLLKKNFSLKISRLTKEQELFFISRHSEPCMV